ncbi:MAG: hypothetical protein OXL98_04455 [Acidimicrobiaceae bacterium]|nr:hypothetical protein [Acidimicrobiaceae bacterium]
MTAPSLNCPTSKPTDDPTPATETTGRPPRRRGDRALTTLEWLLIVAAVAGIAALAVVLVQNVVSDTSEQIAGSSARQVAARLAADQVEVDSQRSKEEQPINAKAWGQWERFYNSRCNRLAITYGDTGMNFNGIFKPPTGATATSEIDNTKIVVDAKTATSTNAAATCEAA